MMALMPQEIDVFPSFCDVICSEGKTKSTPNVHGIHTWHRIMNHMYVKKRKKMTVGSVLPGFKRTFWRENVMIDAAEKDQGGHQKPRRKVRWVPRDVCNTNMYIYPKQR